MNNEGKLYYAIQTVQFKTYFIPNLLSPPFKIIVTIPVTQQMSIITKLTMNAVY